MGYTKNIAVIKGAAGGFSADGGELSGLVKAERYSGELKVEVSLINFAPLSGGKYVAGISDGKTVEIVENGLFEGPSEADTSAGFAAAVCYVNGGVKLIATAVCGNFSMAVPKILEYIARTEEPAPPKKEAKAAPAESYDDEAVATENYYELGKTDEGGEPVREGEKEEKDGPCACEDEEDPDSREENFYKKMKGEIERVLSSYPPAAELNAATENSRWVEISYEGGAFYVFGVICEEGAPKYLCYGIPAQSREGPPASMEGMADYLEVKTSRGNGFWVMYQSAETGKTILP